MPTTLNLFLSGGSVSKESTCNAGDPGSILGWEDPLEKEMATHFSILAWEVHGPRTEEPSGLQSLGSQESDTTERLHFHFSLLCIGEGNGNPLQNSCLENPWDRGAWWATVQRVAKSWTRLKQPSMHACTPVTASFGWFPHGILICNYSMSYILGVSLVNYRLSWWLRW